MEIWKKMGVGVFFLNTVYIPYYYKKYIHVQSDLTTKQFYVAKHIILGLASHLTFSNLLELKPSSIDQWTERLHHHHY